MGDYERGILALFLFDRLNPYGLVTNEYTFAFIRLWWSPLANLRGKQAQLVLVSATQEDFRWVRNFCLDVVRHWYDDRMAEAKLHVEPRSTHPFQLSPGVFFERSTVPNANEVQRYCEALCHTGHRILNESAGETPHGPLLLDLRIVYTES